MRTQRALVNHRWVPDASSGWHVSAYKAVIEIEGSESVGAIGFKGALKEKEIKRLRNWALKQKWIPDPKPRPKRTGGGKGE
jgi:hypothetical protein